MEKHGDNEELTTSEDNVVCPHCGEQQCGDDVSPLDVVNHYNELENPQTCNECGLLFNIEEMSLDLTVTTRKVTR